MKKHGYKKLTQCLLYTGIGISGCLHAQTSLDANYDVEQQTIEHFGASDAWSIDPTISGWMQEGDEASIEALANLLFSPTEGIGLTAWRFNIGAGSAEQASQSRISDPFRRAQLLIDAPNGTVDETKQAGQIRFLQEAHARGVENFVAFVNSPPVWATKNGLAHPGGSGSRSLIGSTNLRDDAVDDFANFLIDVLQYLRGDSVGVPVNYISPINEPTWEWEGQSQEANRYNNDDVKAVYKSVYDALVAASLDDEVQIDAAEVVEFTAALGDDYKIQFNGSRYTGGMNNKGYGDYKNYIPELLGNAEYREMLGNHISVHGYWSDAWQDRMGELRDLTWQNIQAVSPGAKVWMSEMSILGGSGNVRDFDGHGFDVNDMDYALHVAKMLHRDLTRLNASAWHWWLGLTPYDYKDGLVKISPSLDGDTVQDSKMMWTVGNYSRFIRPGAKRLAMANPDNLDGVMASAYKSEDGQQVVFVVVNASNTAEPIVLNISGLPEGKTVQAFDVYVTNSGLNLSNQGKGSVSFDVPARSTVTFVGALVDQAPQTDPVTNEPEPVTDTPDDQPAATSSTGGGGSIGLGALVILALLLVFNARRQRVQ